MASDPQDVERLNTALADRYHIESEIGSGGMATVYLATDLRHERKVALKVLRSDLAASLGAERFLQEVRVTANLQHPHILPLFDSGEADGFLFYVMPYIEGESLRERLVRERELPVPEAARLLRDVVDALAAAHRLGVVHRDIKPENVLLSGRHAMVADFGVAKAVSEATGRHKLTTIGVALGTPSYMAPEQAAADEAIDHRADIYAVGAMAYELLTGRPPFAGGTPQQILAAQVMESPQPMTELRTSVPPALETLIMRCLEKKPADRWQSAEEMLPHLEAAVTPSGGMTPTDMLPVTRPVAPVRRRRLIWLTGAGAGAVVVAALYLALLRGGGADLVEDRVAVMPFENRTDRPDLDPIGPMMADLITEGLTRLDMMEIVPASVTIGFARAAGPGVSQVEVRGQMRTLADETSAGIVIRGAYYSLGDSLRLQAEISDEVRRSVLASLQANSPAENPMEGAADLRQRIMGALAYRFDPRRSRTRVSISGGPLPLYDAYIVYMEAQAEAYKPLSERDLGRAIRGFYRAYEMDSTFLAPLKQAVWAHWSLGENAQADSLLMELDGRRDELTPTQVANLDLYRGFVDGDILGTLRAARRDVERSPGSGQKLVVHGFWALALNRPHEALEALSRVDPHSLTVSTPSYFWAELTAAHHVLGQYEEELREARRGREHLPQVLEVLESEIRALAALGRVGEVHERLDEAIAFGSSPVGNLMRRTALELRAHGYPDAARDVLDRAIAWYESRPAAESATAGHRYNLAWVLHDAERWDEAQVLMEQLTQEDPGNIDFLGSLGILAARSGRQDEARRIDRALGELERPYLRGINTLWRGVISAQLGELEQAVKLLRQAQSEGVMFGAGFHREITLEPLRGYEPFEEFLRPKG